MGLSIFVLILIFGLLSINSYSVNKLSLESIRSEKSESSSIRVETQSTLYPQSLSKMQKCDNGFGFPGVCIADTKSLLEKSVPDSVRSTWENMVLPILRNSPSEVDACIGDFNASALMKKNDKISNFNCHEIPYDSIFNMGTLGL
jgi:hypothetical protein